MAGVMPGRVSPASTAQLTALACCQARRSSAVGGPRPGATMRRAPGAAKHAPHDDQPARQSAWSRACILVSWSAVLYARTSISDSVSDDSIGMSGAQSRCAHVVDGRQSLCRGYCGVQSS